MNTILTTTALSALLMGGALIPANAETYLEWFGDAPLETKGELPSPAIGEGTLGPRSELFFETAETRGGPVIDVEIPVRQFSQLTVACFLFPAHDKGGESNEDLISNRSETENTGFRFRKSWSVLIFDAGDGGKTALVKAPRPQGLLSANEWQHIAAVCDQGKVSFYRDGVFLGEEMMEVEAIEVKRPLLRIGGGFGGPEKMHPYSFSGRMTGIYVSDQALSGEEIVSLMKRSVEAVEE